MSGRGCIEIISENEKYTYNLGIKIGKILKCNDIVCLDGELGAGKTVMVKGITQALGVKEYVTSPTFTIVNEYKGKMPVYHLDVYRLGDIDELYDIGFDDYIDNGIMLIEWADNIKSAIPDKAVWIYIKYTDDLNKRIIDIKANDKFIEELKNENISN